MGKKKDKIMRIMAHFNEDNIVEQCYEEESDYDDKDDDNDEESDDEEVFDDVPVSGTCTRSGRQFIPSSRYLCSDWLS